MALTGASSSVAAVAAAFRAARKVTAVCHQHPDADTLGAASACAMLAAKLGAVTEILAVDPPPATWLWLPRADAIARRPTLDADLVVLCDCATLDRVGTHSSISEGWLANATIVNIDHHVTNTYYGHLNLVMPDAAATSEIVVQLARELGVGLDAEMATVLLAGIIRDTRGFSDPSTSASTLRTAAELVDAGAPLARIGRSVFGDQSRNALALWGRVLAQTREAAEGRIVYGSVTRDLMEQSGAADEDAEGLVELLASASGVVVAILARELAAGATRISIRSTGSVNAHAVASIFGGGGHRTRAGCALTGPIEINMERVVAEALRQFDEA